MTAVRRFSVHVFVVVGVLLLLFLVTSCTQAQSNNDCARFVRDATLPDGTVLQAGTTQQKTWTVQNCGTSTWTGYKIVRVYWEGAAEGKSALPSTTDIQVLGPQQSGNITVPITVPSKPGRYRYWLELATSDGTHRFGDILWVDFTVG